jgi:hypothetical protein
MGRTLGRFAVPLFLVVAVVSLQPSAWASEADAVRARRGVSYLASNQLPDGSIPAFSSVGSTADAVSAFVAAQGGRPWMNRAIEFLREQTIAGNVNTVGLRAKVVMALVAGSRNPRNFGGHNLVTEIRSSLGPDGRYGGEAVLDDALAVLAIRAAGGPQPASVSTWLLNAQCPDGGWAYDEPYDPVTDDAHCHSGPSDFFDSDSNTTSYAVQALVAIGRTGWAADPFGFFDTVRDPGHGGWSYSASFVDTDTNSTSLVIQAFVAGGVPVPAGGVEALRALQRPGCGGWAYSWNGSAPGPADIGATIAAVPAILLVPLPVPRAAVGAGLPAVQPCP